ncbi:hypothetical protein MRB53_001045 [Persea americana]|uniref:Uncharacterized protein n=1 Tax=Persea americana TaxID=3435 RepID=A0ACC2MQJ9_PERAE|nr:hypothetical protein MRB53_001045 [Persea americana]
MAVQAQQYLDENLCFPLAYSQEMGGFIDIQPSSIIPQQRNQRFIINSQLSSSDDLASTTFSHFLASQIEKQRNDMDEFIVLQNERLRVTIQEKRKQQIALLLKTLEVKTLFLLRQKEEEIAKQNRKKAELEFCLKRMEMEIQTWQRIASEKEAMVFSLNTKIEQVMREKVCSSSTPAQDAESCCDLSPSTNPSEQREKMACKACNSRVSCILILPCRHLCSCEACEALLDSCPVCNSVKMASMEVYMS